MIVSVECLSHDHLLAVKFADKSQLRTTLKWINSKSDLIYGRYLHPEHREKTREGDGVQWVDDKLLLSKPYHALGKLFYTHGEEPGRIGSCTASLLGERDTLLTAAHCVMSEEGVWNTDFFFVSPYGAEGSQVYSINCIVVPRKWGALLGAKTLEYDYAVLQLNRAAPHRPLELQSSMPRQIQVIGFSDLSYSGKHLVEIKARDYDVIDAGLFLRMKNNSMGEGSSGSPWLDTESGKVVSLSSHYHEGRKLRMEGPKLGPRLMRLVDYAHQGCSD